MDLIQRAAERLKREGNTISVVEKAAARRAAAIAGRTETDNAAVENVAAFDAATAAAPQAANAGPAPERRRVEIDLGRLRVGGFVTPGGVRSRISEEYRIIKRPLLNHALVPAETRAPRANMIFVTSATPGEGKTFTATNLAMSIASERGVHVLLIDADVIRPTLFRTLGVPLEKGLTDVLADDRLTLPDVLLRTNIPNLTLMSAGTASVATTELFASPKMTEVMRDLATRYQDRVVILDGSPVLATSEASVLARHVGQIAFVVEAGQTGRRALEEALNLVSACPNISLILNKMDQTKNPDGFGSYAYYDPAIQPEG
jgi:protein-tyrosine kinase